MGVLVGLSDFNFQTERWRENNGVLSAGYQATFPEGRLNKRTETSATDFDYVEKEVMDYRQSSCVLCIGQLLKLNQLSRQRFAPRKYKLQPHRERIVSFGVIFYSDFWLWFLIVIFDCDFLMWFFRWFLIVAVNYKLWLWITIVTSLL